MTKKIEDDELILTSELKAELEQIHGMLDILYNELRPAHDHRTEILDKLAMLEELMLVVISATKRWGKPPA